MYGVPKNITLKYTLMGVHGPSMDHLLLGVGVGISLALSLVHVGSSEAC